MDEQIHNDPQKDESSDTIAAVSKTSKVLGNQSAKQKKSNLYWMIGGLAAVILVAMIFSGHKHQVSNDDDLQPTKANYETELQQNLAQLQAQHQGAITETDVPVSTGEHFSKEYLARQNAPTNIFSAPPPDGQPSISTPSHQNGDVQQATLSDKSMNAKFANQGSKTTTENAYKIEHPHYTIASGEFIHAELETAVDSDLPGMVRAVITRPVYAYVGEFPLIPAGSRLVGQYSSAVLQGQNRVMVVWNRILLPNGISVNVNSPGIDELGRAGQLADAMDTHFFKRFGEAVLLSVIGAGVANYGVSSNDQYNSAAQYRSAIAESFQQSAQQSLQNTLAMKPTLHIYQGANINVFVAHDLSFYQVLGHEGNA